MTAEHQPAAAGLDFAVRMTKDDFVGKAALGDRAEPVDVLRSIVFDDPAAVALGKEPVYRRRRAASATSPARLFGRPSGAPSPTRGCPPRRSVGDAVTVDYRGTRHTAVVHAEPVVDPEMTRIKR